MRRQSESRFLRMTGNFMSEVWLCNVCSLVNMFTGMKLRIMRWVVFVAHFVMKNVSKFNKGIPLHAIEAYGRGDMCVYSFFI